jgi:hypothetical protein
MKLLTILPDSAFKKQGYYSIIKCGVLVEFWSIINYVDLLCSSSSLMVVSASNKAMLLIILQSNSGLSEFMT